MKVSEMAFSDEKIGIVFSYVLFIFSLWYRVIKLVGLDPDPKSMNPGYNTGILYADLEAFRWRQCCGSAPTK